MLLIPNAQPSIKAAKASIQVVQTSIHRNKTPIKVAQASIKVGQTFIHCNKTPIKVAKTSIKMMKDQTQKILNHGFS